MKKIINKFKNNGYNVCCLYLIDSTFIKDSLKFNSALLNSVSAMIMLSIPFINVVTKMDLLNESEKQIVLDGGELIYSPDNSSNNSNVIDTSIQKILETFSHQSCVPFDKNDPRDYYVISNYIDRMLCKDDDNYENDLQ